MTAFAIWVTLGQYFDGSGLEVYGRRRGPRYEIAAKRGTDPEKAWLLFEAAVEELVQYDHVDPRTEVVVWLGVLDIISRDFSRLGGPHVQSDP